MTKLGSAALLACLLVGCSSDAPPCANVGLDMTLAESPLARLQNVSLIRTGDSFILAGYDNGQVRWARIGLDGTLTQETSFALAKPLVGPVFAATMRSSPGDQLVAIGLVGSATAAGGYDLSATVHTLGEAAPAAPIVLNSLNAFPTGTELSSVKLAAGAAASGTVGYVAFGVNGPNAKGKPIYYSMLPANAAVSATPSTFLGEATSANAPAWDCLAPQGKPSGFSIGAVTQNTTTGPSNFETLEVDEDGATRSMTYQLSVAVIECEIVGNPVSDGSYFMALQGNQNGSVAIDFATYYPPTNTTDPGVVTTQHPVMPAALFGDPLSMPTPAWVGAAGSDIVVGLDRKAGPQVVRFRWDTVKRGSTLQLRSATGNSGPIAAWATDNLVYVTYADQVQSGGATTSQRYFMRIDSPANLP